jgi:hypothetical protein
MSITAAVILIAGTGLLCFLWGMWLGIEIGRDKEWFDSTFTEYDTPKKHAKTFTRHRISNRRNDP